MIDLAKRNSMKAVVKATTLGLAATSAPLALLAQPAASRSNANTAVPVTHATDISDLSIDIVSSRLTGRDTLLITNLTDHTIPVKHFSPGTVRWKNQWGTEQFLDLNAIRSHDGLFLPANSALSLSHKRKLVSDKLANNFSSQYSWADDALMALDSDTDRVTLGAYISNQQLHVYPIPVLAIAA